MQRAGIGMLVAALAVAGCSPAKVPAVAEGAEHIACAVGGAADLAPVCAVERVLADGILLLVVRHPDGGFRRFEVLRDGRGLALADGAEQALIQYGASFVDLAVGSDRYRFPVTVKPDAPAR